VTSPDQADGVVPMSVISSLVVTSVPWQAAEGAKEAREWISNWREGKTKGVLLL